MKSFEVRDPQGVVVYRYKDEECQRDAFGFPWNQFDHVDVTDPDAPIDNLPPPPPPEQPDEDETPPADPQPEDNQ